MQKDLIQKYNVPGPRYTSYPTVPYWENNPMDIEGWKKAVKVSFDESNQSQGISLYIHLPFCSHMCHYCGCNVRFTQNHKVEIPYIDKVLKEWKMYLDLLEDTPQIAELHLGGGTPTFFSAEHLEYLIQSIFNTAVVREDAELSFEAHPNNTTEEHFSTLYKLGFRRVSFGIQDFDPKVQEVINRVQTFDQVEKVVRQARETGFESINFDLIYGLPLQTNQSIIDTMEKVSRLKPDRIAYYSYAHVPWIKGIQRKFTEADLPKDEEKRMLYELGKQIFEEQGYLEVGMDHFALETDSLAIAFKEMKMHRNFMGYSSNTTQLMVGLGVSSISDSWTAFAQNEKTIRKYEAAIEKEEFPIFRGHLLDEEDLIIRRHILNIMCHFKTSWKEESEQVESLYEGMELLKEMEKDGLLLIEPFQLTVTEAGKPFVRNICMAIDARLKRNQPSTRIFSSTI